MALTQCKECGAQVSTTAKCCPQCGAVERRSSSYWWIALALVLGVLAFLAFGYFNSNPAKQKAQLVVATCWAEADKLYPFTPEKRTATEMCQAMVKDYEAKFGTDRNMRQY